ncbi:MAG: amino acid permease [Acidobacteria bacterium]|nr:amino acid permease [Acidobacteriota bacterium]
MEDRKFVRALGLTDSTMIVAGSMIGSGIFIVSADIARTVASPGWLLMVWVITGILTISAALSYGELAALMPKAGGQYVYLREAYSPLWGFLYGWTLFMVIQTGTIAAVAVAFAKFLGVLVPQVSGQHLFFDFGKISLGGFNLGLSLSTQQAVAIIVIALLTYSNSNGIRTGKLVQDVFTITKVGALLGLILLGLLIGRNDGAAIQSSDFWTPALQDGSLMGAALLAAVCTSMVGSLFSSDAWNNITFTAGEVINPRRNIPLSLALGTSLVTLIYVLANVVYVSVLPLAGIQHAAEDRVGTAAAQVIFGESGTAIMAVAIMISTFGCENGLVLAGARVYYAMARDGLFFRGVGGLNTRGVPAKGLLVQGIWAALLTLSGTYGELLDYVVFAALLFYVLTVGGIFILRRTKPDVPRPYKAFGYPIVPAAYIVAAAVILVELLIHKPNYTWPGLIIVLTGIPVYYAWKWLGAPPSASRAVISDDLE